MMPEETPNNSTERLQRYAKERREQGGDFSLHPATRRMLQGEVARTYGATGATVERRGFMAWLNSWTARFALGTAALVLVGGVVIWKNSQPKEFTMELASAPATEAVLADPEGSKGVAEKDKQLAFAPAPAPASQPGELARKSEAPLRRMTLLAENAADTKSNSLDKSAMDRLSAAETLAQNTPAATFQAQSAQNTLANNAAPTPEPAMRNQAAVNYFNTTDALPPGAPRARAFDYAQTDGRGLARGGRADDTALRLQNQGESASGGAPAQSLVTANYARNETRSLAENEAMSRGQNLAGGVLQNDAFSQADSRARVLRSAGPAPVAAPATVATLDAEPQTRGALATGTATPANDDSATRFYRAAQNAPGKLLTTLSAAGTAPVAVLSDFTIEQRGQTVRVLDGDGSVYEGAIETPPTASFVPATLAPRESDGAALEKFVGAQAEAPARHQELSFRASGSNVTLREIVVVNARFSPGAGGAPAAPAQPREAAAKQNDIAARRAAPVASSNAFAGRYGLATNATAASLEGTVRIGTTNQQWFRATRR